jgi:hypothetical protein
MSIGSGGLSAPITTPSKRSPHPTASIRISLLEKKQSSAKHNHHRVRINIGGSVFLFFVHLDKGKCIEFLGKKDFLLELSRNTYGRYTLRRLKK